MPTATHSDLGRIADRVRRERARRGWSQRQLAERIDGVSLRTVEYIEAAARRASITTYGRIAIALGVELSDLIGEGDR